jgi:hypothetical protein
MKLSNLKTAVFAVSLCLVLLLAGFIAVQISTSTLAQNAESKLNKTDGVSWKPNKKTINASNSKIKLNILEKLANHKETVFAVKPIKNGEQETVSVGMVSWELLPDKAGEMGFKKISKITDYTDQLSDISMGSVEIDDKNNLVSENETLVVYLNLSPQTEVSLWKGTDKILSSFPEDGFIFQNGVKKANRLKGLYEVINQLQTEKLASGIQNKMRGGN